MSNEYPQDHRAPRPSYSGEQPRKPQATGHELVLKAIMQQERTIYVTLQSGVERVGRLVGKDKFTITVKTEDGHRRVIYKSSIEEFYADETSPAQPGK